MKKRKKITTPFVMWLWTDLEKHFLKHLMNERWNFWMPFDANFWNSITTQWKGSVKNLALISNFFTTNKRETYLNRAYRVICSENCLYKVRAYFFPLLKLSLLKHVSIISVNLNCLPVTIFNIYSYIYERVDHLIFDYFTCLQ